MIRKPDAREFRESDTIATLRDAGTLARVGAKGVGENAARTLGRMIGGLFLIAFLATIGSHLGQVGVLFGLASVVTLVALGIGKRDRADRWNEADGQGAAATGRFEPDVMALGRAAATFAVPAVLFFPTRHVQMTGVMLPFTIGSSLYVSLAMLTLLRLFGDRTLIRWDAEMVTVRGLTRDASMLWSDVDDIGVERTTPLNLQVLFNSGSRRNLVLSGERNRLGGPKRLYLPVNIIDLKGDSPAVLVSRMLALRKEQGSPAGRPDIRGGARPPVPVPAARAIDDQGFDPDAIIPRYIAERDLSPADSDRPLPSSPRTFGRKRAA